MCIANISVHEDTCTVFGKIVRNALAHIARAIVHAGALLFAV